MIKAKPFLKWAGGKTQLLKEIANYYPFNNDINKYVEPFVGSGAVLFDILNKYQLESVYISDVNKELINCYVTIKENVESLVLELSELEKTYLALSENERKIFYNKKREEFNILKNTNYENSIALAGLFIFLNKTCFNGLYRVNSKGDFNVPVGSYKNPKICDTENLRNVSKVLKNVVIKHADYKECYDFVDKNTFIYFDPPYRPLNKTSSFNSYAKNNFNDNEQKELAEFCKMLDKKGVKILLSNSNPKNTDTKDTFFDELYKDFVIKEVSATRMINSKGNSRGKITEILVRNFKRK